MELWDIYDSEGNNKGRTSVRGKPLQDGDYHLVVLMWIRNSNGQYLISRRSENKVRGGQLETAGGSALSGEDSIGAIIREVKEELGIVAKESELKLLSRDLYPSECSFIGDVWLLERDIDIKDVVVQEEEVAEAMWLERSEVVKLIAEKDFFNWHIHEKLVESKLI